MTKIDSLADEITKALREYSDNVFSATEEGLNQAQRYLIRQLRNATPKDTGEFRKGWIGTGKKYKGIRLIGNTKTVKGKKGKEVPLSNIFEFSTTRGKPFIRKTRESAENEIVNILFKKIEEV